MVLLLLSSRLIVDRVRLAMVLLLLSSWLIVDRVRLAMVLLLLSSRLLVDPGQVGYGSVVVVFSAHC